jgi:hypothetical protein
MKKLLCALLAVLALSACFGGSSAWKVTTDQGKEYMAASKPELDEDTDTYTFENTQGEQVVLPRSLVREMREVQPQD